MNSVYQFYSHISSRLTNIRLEKEMKDTIVTTLGAYFVSQRVVSWGIKNETVAKIIVFVFTGAVFLKEAMFKKAEYDERKNLESKRFAAALDEIQLNLDMVSLSLEYSSKTSSNPTFLNSEPKKNEEILRSLSTDGILTHKKLVELKKRVVPSNDETTNENLSQKICCSLIGPDSFQQGSVDKTTYVIDKMLNCKTTNNLYALACERRQDNKANLQKPDVWTQRSHNVVLISLDISKCKIEANLENFKDACYAEVLCQEGQRISPEAFEKLFIPRHLEELAKKFFSEEKIVALGSVSISSVFAQKIYTVTKSESVDYTSEEMPTEGSFSSTFNNIPISFIGPNYYPSLKSYFSETRKQNPSRYYVFHLVRLESSSHSH